MKPAQRNQFRINMRVYAKLYRDAIAFGRHYRDYDPPVYERWCVRAGLHLAAAIHERDLAMQTP